MLGSEPNPTKAAILSEYFYKALFIYSVYPPNKPFLNSISSNKEHFYNCTLLRKTQQTRSIPSRRDNLLDH